MHRTYETYRTNVTHGTWRACLRLCCASVAVFALAVLPTSARHFDTPTIEDLASTNVLDLQATVQVSKADSMALEQINRDFALAYKLLRGATTLTYKDPNKLRLKNRIALVVYNGATRYINFPPLPAARKEVGDAPTRRYSLLDIGLLTKAGLGSSMSRHLRDEMLDGVPTSVYEMTFRDDDSTRYVVWVHPTRQITLKREWYDSADKLKATFAYKDALEIAPGIWAPTSLEIRNGSGALAGTMKYTDIKVNQGLMDDLFNIP